jgi:hypothetical protein
MTGRLSFIATFVIATLISLAGTADAHHSWAHYHWARTANPFTLQLGDNVSSTWDPNLAQASSDWSGGDPDSAGYTNVLQTHVVTGTGAGVNRNGAPTCNPVTGTVQVCDANYGNNGWLGLAQIWITTGSHIVQGVTQMNDYYWTAAAAYPYANEAEQQHVVCQEVGHTFGLDHQSTDGSSLNTCMDYYHNTTDSDLQSTTPNAHDFEQLAKIYGHLDRTTTVAASGSAGSAVWTNGRAPDGTPFGASPANGHWYVEALADGELLLTHVYWK